MTETKKRVLKGFAIAILVAVLFGLCVYGFIYGMAKYFFSTHEKELTKFTNEFLSVCEENGLDLSEAEFLSGTYRYALRDSTYLVSFRVPAEKEHLLFSENQPGKREIYDHEKQNLPDGVEYVWVSEMTDSWFMWLYRSEDAADGYVYCYVQCGYY